MPRKSAQALAQERVGIRLSSHEKLCAERMVNIQKSIERLERKCNKLEFAVTQLRAQKSTMQHCLRSVTAEEMLATERESMLREDELQTLGFGPDSANTPPGKNRAVFAISPAA